MLSYVQPQKFQDSEITSWVQVSQLLPAAVWLSEGYERLQKVGESAVKKNQNKHQKPILNRNNMVKSGLPSDVSLVAALLHDCVW